MIIAGNVEVEGRNVRRYFQEENNEVTSPEFWGELWVLQRGGYLAKIVPSQKASL
jgi:hypothetical protein